MTIKRKKYILVGTISNSTLTFLPLQLNSLRFLEFRGSLLTILATVSYVTTSCVTTWLHVTHLLHITAQHIRSSLAAFGSPGFERPVSPPSTIALSSATERGLSRLGLHIQSVVTANLHERNRFVTCKFWRGSQPFFGAKHFAPARFAVLGVPSLTAVSRHDSPNSLPSCPSSNGSLVHQCIAGK